jgi:chorismate mutase
LSVRGIRGATTVNENNRESILAGTRELLLTLRNANSFKTEDIVSIFFSMTSDLNAAFPAEATRQLGWNEVPLFGMQEADVIHSLPKCIRVLIHINCGKSQTEIVHCYLREAEVLRKDLVNKNLSVKENRLS